MSRTQIFSVFHQVLNRARWSPLAASWHVLQLLIETFGQAGGSVDIVIDETVARRWGRKIRTRGHSRASARSSHERSVSSPGLRWIVLAVVVRAPWTQQRWALPFLGVLATTPEVSAQPAAGDPPQNARRAGSPSGESATALAARSTDQAPGRPGLQYPRAWAALRPAAGHAHCALSARLHFGSTP
jgi:hypothetical protein